MKLQLPTNEKKGTCKKSWQVVRLALVQIAKFLGKDDSRPKGLQNH